jgi:hypothetical protein
MSRFYILATTSACLLGLTGIVIGAIGLTNIPNSLTRDEMYVTGAACSPERCSQMLAEKQLASEGVKLSITGIALFLVSLLCTFAVFIYINYCSDRSFRRVHPNPTEQVSSSQQTDQPQRHSPSTTGASQPTSASNAPQE